jgi:hypothetical protein
MSGEYVALFTYLDNRYAQTVVLTLEQIEAILGFALPAAAHTDALWWTASAETSSRSPYSDAWVLASRTAVPNLQARIVTFERAS